MPVPIEDRYKVLFEHHRFVSEYRLSLVKAWGAIYVALAAAFVWTQSSAPKLSWGIGLVAIITTILLWIADRRHRPAIGVLKDVGSALETDPSADIPENQRYFVNLNKNKGISHSKIIDWFTWIVISLLLISTIYLFFSKGELPW